PFRATRLTLTSGQTLSGLVTAETGESVELLLADGSRRIVPRRDVEERELSRLSPMPVGLVRTPAELRDLLAYPLSDRPLPPGGTGAREGRVGGVRVGQRGLPHAPPSLPGCVGEFLESKHDGRWVGPQPQCAGEPVPHREHRGEVRVGFGLLVGVVDLV